MRALLLLYYSHGSVSQLLTKDGKKPILVWMSEVILALYNEHKVHLTWFLIIDITQTRIDAEWMVITHWMKDEMETSNQLNW